MKRAPALLALSDGTVFRGEAAGAPAPYPADDERRAATGEVVFNTSLSGYQEIFTDPSYAGQIVAMTYPHIGNYGVNAADSESRKIFAAGVVMRELSRTPSSWRSEESLEDFLVSQGCPAITGVDTRRLTRHLRSRGSMTGVIFHGDVEESAAVDAARAAPGIEGRDLVAAVTTDRPYLGADPPSIRYSIAAYDFGIKRRILEQLEQGGMRVTVYPASVPADEILATAPDGVFLSNGPGDPAAVEGAVENTRILLGKVPVFGICLGHQILGLALGAETYKLPFGHHGGNHPVRNLDTGHVEVTSQNHGFAVDPASLGAKRATGLPWGEGVQGVGPLRSAEFGKIDATHLNLNDATLEGIRCLDVPAFSVQYHPEAAPGPHDARYLFDDFAKMLGEK